MEISSATVIEAVLEIERGVDYDPEAGARCPVCGARLRVIDTMPQCGTCRVRYQRCVRPGCPLAEHRRRIKTVENYS